MTMMVMTSTHLSFSRLGLNPKWQLVTTWLFFGSVCQRCLSTCSHCSRNWNSCGWRSCTVSVCHHSRHWEERRCLRQSLQHQHLHDIVAFSYFITRQMTIDVKTGKSKNKLSRVVNIAIQVSLSPVSVILLEYRRKYRRYFLHEVSHAVSPILFQPNFSILSSDTY